MDAEKLIRELELHLPKKSRLEEFLLSKLEEHFARPDKAESKSYQSWIDERLGGQEQVSLHPAPPMPVSFPVNLMGVRYGRPKYALNEQGELIGLNMAALGLTNEQWERIMDVLKQHDVRLQALNLCENRLTRLTPPPNVEVLEVLDVSGNELEDVPAEIVEQGPDAILLYLKQLAREAGRQKKLYEAKLIIVGEAGAGKTTLARKLKDPEAPLPAPHETTHGIEVSTWAFPVNGDDNTFHTNLWDFGGQEIYHSTHQFFFSERSVYVLVADTREQKTDFSYWLNTVEQLTGEDSPLIVVLNKREGHRWRIDEPGLRKRFGGLLKACIEADLSNPDEVHPLQERIAEELQALPDVAQELIESWVQIRRELEGWQGPWMSFADFLRICKEKGHTNFEDIELIIRYFTRIGVFTHFLGEPALQDRIWLDSNWLCKTVYRLLDDEEVRQKNGRLDKAAIERVWKDNELRFEIGRLVVLLQRYGLMYKVKDENLYIVPEHLPAAQPYESWAHEGDPDILCFRYRFDKYMPKGLMPQLIVALHDFIPDHTLLWNRGVNLSYKGAHAEIVELYGGENIFDIRIAGAMKRDLLVLITREFDRILKPFRKLQVKRSIRCICSTCKESEEPYWHSIKDIEQVLVVKGSKGKGFAEITVECKKSYEDIPVKDLLSLVDFDKVLKDIQEAAKENPALQMVLEEIRALHRRHDETQEKVEVVDEKLDRLLEGQEGVKRILQNLEEGRIEVQQQREVMEEMIGLLKALAEQGKLDKEKLKEIEAAPTLKSQLTLTIPLIPTVLSYQTTFAWDWGKFKKKLCQIMT